jgi:archaeal flagellar protein FlaI
VNATLSPVSTKGNTITIRKFAADPWTITDFMKLNTMDLQAAAMVWMAIEHELSVLIAGGTGSGKTSMLNVLSNFFPPNQRIISIEDTRELTLPNMLHWIPMETRLPNPEGKGAVSMLDLLINSLRQRPDRIVVGEIRRKREAEVLFEAMHTGHSVYATIHANTASETITRITNPPIDIPKLMTSSLSLIVVMNRDRRSGKRRTFQLAQVTPQGDAEVFMQYDVRTDKLKKVKDPDIIFDTLNLYSGLGRETIKKEIEKKVTVLTYFLKNGIENVHDIGFILSHCYRGLSPAKISTLLPYLPSRKEVIQS